MDSESAVHEAERILRHRQLRHERRGREFSWRWPVAFAVASTALLLAVSIIIAMVGIVRGWPDDAAGLIQRLWVVVWIVTSWGLVLWAERGP